MESPVLASQSRIVLSDPETIYLPSGETVTDVTPLVCPSNAPGAKLPVSTSQIRTVVSLDPETMCLPSGENATEYTSQACPSSDTNMRPVSASQVLIVPLRDPEVMHVSSGENAREVTKSMHPSNTRSPDSTSRI